MYSKYEWVFTRNGVEIRKVVEDPLLGTDIRKKEVSYKDLQSIVGRTKPIIKSIEPVIENNVLKALKFEILLQIDSKEPKVTEKSLVESERVPIVEIEKAIIKAIGDLDGRASRDRVHEKVREMIKEFESPYYQQVEPNGYIRWKHRVDSVKAILVSRGYIKKSSESGRGVWELTEKGWEYYEHLR